MNNQKPTTHKVKIAAGTNAEQREALVSQMVANGGWNRADASEAYDLAQHACDQAVKRLEEVTSHASSLQVMMEASSLSAQMLQDRSKFIATKIAELHTAMCNSNGDFDAFIETMREVLGDEYVEAISAESDA